MNKIINKFSAFSIFTLFCLVFSPAHAYVGPASSSMGTELLIAVIVVAIIMVIYSGLKYFRKSDSGKEKNTGE